MMVHPLRSNGLRVLAGLVLLAVSAPAAVSAEDVVARVGETGVSVKEIRAYLDTLSEDQRRALDANPAMVSQLVRAYLARLTVLAEAREAKFDRKPDVVTALEQARDDALLELYLRSVAKVPDDYPSASDLAAAYEANKAAFMQPRQYRVAQIYIATGDAKADTAKQRLADVRKKLKAKGADFFAVARESSDSDAANGGVLGWLPEPQVVPAIRDVLAGLAKGQVSEPIRLADGWHVVKLMDTRPAGVPPLKDVEETLRDQLRQARYRAARQGHLRDLMRDNPVTLNELALSRLTRTAK